MEESYEERVAEVFNEEFCRSNVVRRDLPEKVQDALNRIEIRLAAEMENCFQKGKENSESVRAAISAVMLATYETNEEAQKRFEKSKNEK